MSGAGRGGRVVQVASLIIVCALVSWQHALSYATNCGAARPLTQKKRCSAQPMTTLHFAEGFDDVFDTADFARAEGAGFAADFEDRDELGYKHVQGAIMVQVVQSRCFN